MKDDKGKVIVSLIAGATAGIVAGLLLAPETGDDTRTNLRKSATKFGGDLSQLAKDALARVQGKATASPTIRKAKQAADELLQNLGTGTPSTAHTHNHDNPDYDGFGDETRHQPNT